jgi:hypothetical protein
LLTLEDGDGHDDPDHDNDTGASHHRNKLETNSAVNSINKGICIGAKAWDKENDRGEGQSKSESNDKRTYALQPEDPQTVTSLTEDEDKHEEMEALLATEECCFEPPWPSFNERVNCNDDEPDKDFPEVQHTF